jgi:hypothetical protein
MYGVLNTCWLGSKLVLGTFVMMYSFSISNLVNANLLCQIVIDSMPHLI